MKSISHIRRTLIAALVTAAWTNPASAQDIVKIGYSGPLSGGAALYGKNVLDGMQMAINEINADGLTVAGKKYKVEIVALDDKYNPAETGINAQRLVQESKTPVILVPHSGGILALQTTNEAQKYLVLAYSSTPQIVARGNKLTYRIPPEYTGYIQPWTNYVMAKFGKNIAIASADHEYGKAWIQSFKPVWEKSGGKIVAENPMSYNRATDFYSGVSKVLASKPDVLFVGGPSEPTGLVIKQARELGFKGGFMLIDQAKLDEVSKITGGYAPLEGSIGVLPLVEDPLPDAKDFVARYRRAYPNINRDPSSEVSLNYTAVHIAVKAMELAGTVSDAAAIRAQLDKAVKALPKKYNPSLTTGVGEDGGSISQTRGAIVEGGKIKEVALSSLLK